MSHSPKRMAHRSIRRRKLRRARDWDEDYIYSLPLQECDDIEFKGSSTFEIATADGKNKTRADLAKGICALANSGGGMLVIGIKDPKKCKSGTLEVVDGGVPKVFAQSNTTAEWLNATIPQLVDFELRGFIVHAVNSRENNSQIHQDKAIFVIEIPDSELAPHQSREDKKYYVRLGGNSLPATHRMVMDIVGRQKHPNLEVEFGIVVEPYDKNKHASLLEIPLPEPLFLQSLDPSEEFANVTLWVRASNNGKVFAQYVKLDVFVPIGCFSQHSNEVKYRTKYTRNHLDYLKFSFTNRIEQSHIGEGSNSWFEPILPGRRFGWDIKIRNNWMRWRQNLTSDLVIEWDVSADNAIPSHGEIILGEVHIQDKRKNTKP